MTKLPNGWEVKKLEEIAKITSGGTPSRSKNEFWENGSIPWVKIKDMKEDYIKSTEEFITDLGLSNSSAKLFPKGTLLYSIFATLGEVGILDINAATNQAIAGITIKQDDINTVFMMYYLKSIKNEVMKKGRGVAQNNLNISMLKELEVPLPSLEEQRKIVKMLDEKFASIDEGIKLAKVDLLSLDELWQSILNDSFNPLKSKLDNVKYPKTWEIKKLKDLGIFIRGVSYKKEQLLNEKDENSVFLLRANNIQSQLNLDELQIVPKELAENKIIQDNDILFAMSSGSKHIVGKNIILKDLNDFSFGAFCGVFRATDESLNPYFLSYYLKSFEYHKYIQGVSKGSNINNLRFKDLEEFQIPLPPLKEQERIAKELESKAKTIKELKELYAKRLKDYEELKESLLDLAFKGGL